MSPSPLATGLGRKAMGGNLLSLVEPLTMWSISDPAESAIVVVPEVLIDRIGCHVVGPEWP